MTLPDRYKDLAVRCDARLEKMGMPKEQREPYLADLIGLVGLILDGYFQELSERRPTKPTNKPNEPPP